MRKGSYGPFSAIGQDVVSAVWIGSFGQDSRHFSGARRSRSTDRRRSLRASPGQWFEVEAGLHYNWHRHYDPMLDRRGNQRHKDSIF